MVQGSKFKVLSFYHPAVKPFDDDVEGMRFRSNKNSPSKLEGVAWSVGGWIKYPSVPCEGSTVLCATEAVGSPQGEGVCL